MTTAQQSVIDPFQLLNTYNTYKEDTFFAFDDYCRIVKDQFLNYYIGISDLRCEGKFKERKDKIE
ncbi:hypothetical protein [endosymbiont GvMRE of Glomus versiforme]|uniref:hypothetical protein n=1 Tax=endosymbiont GvMRE of Glomus versiforme TaxID=2039283 RepID=UPI000ECF0DD5|nr:hypothetical protein [endosymbiont GvMRE of Glomus versiforme]RHZ36060.1 hypothetical protein GvMRE_Ic3g52 [endosymbiont GvMRE of Glomus versiforme]